MGQDDTAKKTKKWFADNGVVLLEGWPANSPDLSPIEQIWSIAKCYIIQRYGMKTPLTLQQLKTAVFDVYQTIEPRTIAILTRSVKFRVRLCIARNGGFVGDALDENCRRAKEEFDAATRLPSFSVFTAPSQANDDGNGERDERTMPRLPSFRTVQ